MLKTFRALNIDDSRPIVEKKVTVNSKCTKCGINSKLDLKIIANSEEVVLGDLNAKCETKMRGVKNSGTCGNNVNFKFTVKMPKKK